MHPAELKQTLRGVLAFAVTPFRQNYELDLPGLEVTIERLCGSGAGAIVCAGGVGEFYALDLNEYREVIQVAARVARGRIPLLAGIGHSTDIACGLARVAEAAGAAGLMIHPPYFVDPSLDGIVAHFAALGRASRLGQIVFCTGSFGYSPEMMLRLSDIENVIGLKDEIGDLRQFVATVTALGDRMAWINGMAEPLAAAYFASGAGSFTTGLANFCPEIPMAVLETAQSTDHSALQALLDKKVLPLAHLRSKRKGYATAVIKEAMNLLGFPAGPCRRPLLPLLPADREVLSRILVDLRLLEG
ncbi:MAG: dihydrodipicolinate synthase family protein [Acidobacteriota bacterium]